MSKAKQKQTKRRPAARRAEPAAAPAKRRPRKASVPAAQAIPPPVRLEPEVAPRAEPAAMAEPQGLPPDVSLSEPDPDLVARVPPPEPDRPLPPSRRAIFFDVENTSRAEHIARVIDHLAVDRMGKRTDFIAVGNWKVIGSDTARLLARHGAQLVHSAPSTGVRDWSDLRIAVSAGVWLAGARPGDLIEIVSDDRAFDAVGDVAATIGIAFRRLSYRGLLASANEAGPVVHAPAYAPAPAPVDQRGDGGHRRRRGRRRGGWRDRPAHGPAPIAAAPRVHHPPAHRAAPVPVTREAPVDGVAAGVEAHTAPHDELVAVVQDLMQRSPGRGVTLDSLANALKSRGFRRTPGSPRLITRLKRIKELDVSSTGMVTIVGDAPPPRAPAPMPPVREPEPVEERMAAEDVIAGDDASDADDAPGPGNEREPDAAETLATGAPRRRSRRGGRGRRGRGRGPRPAATSV